VNIGKLQDMRKIALNKKEGNKKLTKNLLKDQTCKNCAIFTWTRLKNFNWWCPKVEKRPIINTCIHWYNTAI